MVSLAEVLSLVTGVSDYVFKQVLVQVHIGLRFNFGSRERSQFSIQKVS